MPPREGDGVGRISPIDAFTAFAFLWALASLYHLAKWSYWADSPSHLALTVAVFWLLLRPSSSLRFLALLCAQLWVAVELLPMMSNHLILTAFGSLLMLPALVRRVVAARSWQIDRSALYQEIAPPGRLIFLALFVFAGFHKINADWFRPEVSCGAEVYLRTAERIPLLPSAFWAQIAVIYGVVAVELVVPPMLLTPSLRHVGIFLAGGFLFLNGIAGYFNFAAVSMALLFLFLPEGSIDRFSAWCLQWGMCHRWVAARSSRIGEFVVRVLTVSLFVCAAILALDAEWLDRSPQLVRELATARRPPLSYAFEALWWVYGVAALAIFIILVRSGTRAMTGPRQLLRLRHRSLAIVPLLVVLNGAAPYLGLKTEYSFSMFSNLRTEGDESNHLLVRRPLDLFGYQNDLAVIEDSSDEELKKMAQHGYLLPYVELQSYVREQGRKDRGDFSLAYRRGGRSRRVDIADRDPELNQTSGSILEALVHFRPVDGSGPTACRH